MFVYFVTFVTDFVYYVPVIATQDTSQRIK